MLPAALAPSITAALAVDAGRPLSAATHIMTGAPGVTVVDISRSVEMATSPGTGAEAGGLGGRAPGAAGACCAGRAPPPTHRSSTTGWAACSPGSASTTTSRRHPGARARALGVTPRACV
jgi:hypothetical protein